jgi:RNA polymerase sigma factor (sigma-70 family)
MEQEPLRRLLRQLRRLAEPSGATAASDAELLQRFVARRDHAAFELLLWRHGPMVLGTCRRLLRNPADADDAFQATWLVLVRKAGAVARGEALGGWLHRVACRVALRLRAGLTRRAGRERPLAERLAGPANGLPAQDDLRRVLDEELSRLPARHREAFVLCCLEGKTGAEAARELGCAPGTVSSRLTRARERLRRRLTRRGLAPAAGGVTATLAGEAWAAPLTEPLVNSTLKAVLAFAAPGAALSGPAVSLAEGVLRAMSLTKMKVVLALLLLVGALGSGVALTRRALQAAPPDQTQARGDALPEGTPEPAVAQADVPRRPEASERVIQLLNEVIDLDKVTEVKLKLKDILELLADKMTTRSGKEVMVLINIEAFKAKNKKYTTARILDQDVEFPAFPKRMAIATALGIALSKIPTKDATYLIRGGNLEVTTLEEASPAGLLRQKVIATFRAEPLETALRTLAEQTGASIVIDSTHAAEKAQVPVTATFRHDTSLRGALEILTAMAGLKFVVLEGGGLYVTTPEAAEALRKEQGRGTIAGTNPPLTSPGKPRP